MKSFFILPAFLALAYAQAPTLPKCAQTCVTKFTSGSQIGGCNSADFACICSNPNFLSGIACCLAAPGGCDEADQEAATAYAHNFCGIAGVTNLPASVTCASTSTSAGTSATSGATSSTSLSETTTTAPGSTSTVSQTPTKSSSGSSSGSSTSSTSSSSSTTATPNAAAHNVGGSFGAAILGAAAILL